MGSFFNLRIDGSRRCQMRVPLERGVGDIYCCPRKFKNLMFWNIISNVLMMFIFMFATLHTGPQFYFIFCTFFLSVSQRSRVWIPNKSESGFLFATAKVVYITTTIILHLILHPAVNVYDFHIFKTHVYSVRCHENLFEKYIQNEVPYPDRILVGIRDFMQYRENPDQIGMVGQSSLCEKKTKELNINVMYSLWILPKLVGIY